MGTQEKLLKVIEGNEENHILPFFWQHGEDEETLRKYVNVIYQSNCKALCVESRPHPDFCCDKWWQDMDVIIDESKKLGMKVWILDDSHFPTGYANGAMEDKDPVLFRRSLTVKYFEVPDDAGEFVVPAKELEKADDWQPAGFEKMALNPDGFTIRDDDRLLSVTAINKGGNKDSGLIVLTKNPEDGSYVFKKPEGSGSWIIAAVHITANRGPRRNYINMMDPESVKVLIDAVYEKHYEHYGSEFGKTIEGFFSDEPEIGNGHMYEFDKKIGELDDQAFCRTAETELREKWGDDFDRFLPLIWQQDFDSDLQAKIRFDYMDTVTRLVEKNFSEQIGSWCRQHGVKYIGHLIEDSHQHTRTCSSLGHYFRGLAGQDWAGVDVIGGQVLPQGENIGKGDAIQPMRDGEFWHYTLAKLGGSLAAIDPLKKGNCMCELFGNYGWEEGVKLEKYLADHLLVRGVNQFVPHAFSPAPFPDPDCPPHFYAHGNNPQYRHFGEIMKYMNRAATLLSDGKPKIPVAILYNAEADWAGDFMYLQKPAKEMYDEQIDYHFIPADVFTDEKYNVKLGKELEVNGISYSAFVIPHMEYIPQSAARAAAKLNDAGCEVLFMDSLPVGTIEMGKSDPLIAQLQSMKVTAVYKVEDVLKEDKIVDAVIKPINNRIRIYHYEDLYMVVNEGSETYEGLVTIPGKSNISVYDAWENKFVKAEVTPMGGEACVEIRLDPEKSLFLIRGVDYELIKKAGYVPELSEKKTDISVGWERSICTATKYPEFSEKKIVKLPDNLAEEMPKFSGFVRYERNYNYDGEGNAILEITDASEGVEVFVNDVSLGIQVVPAYIYDMKPYLKKGENLIRIEVATTLERQAVDFPSKWGPVGGKKQPQVPSGICGKVLISK